MKSDQNSDSPKAQKTTEEHIDLEKLIKLVPLNPDNVVKSSKDRDTVFYKTHTQDKNIFFNNQPVKRIKIIAQADTFNPASRDSRLFMRVHDEKTFIANIEISTLNGNKILLNMAATYNEVKALAKQLNMTAEEAYVHKGVDRPDDIWKDYTADQVYERRDFFGTKTFYQDLRPRMATQIAKVAKANKIDDVQLLVFGTGAGDDTREFVKKLQEEHIAVKATGFDINEYGIKLAKDKQEEISSKDDVTFKQGNTLDLLQLYQNETQAHPTATKKSSTTILAFCGSLTREVIGGTVNGLRVLQQACRCGDMMFSAGLAPTVFNGHMAKRCGWNFEAVPLKKDDEFGTLFQLKKMSPQERSAWLHKQLKKVNRDPNLLDLSKSGNPVADLKLLSPSEIAQVKRIDLTWAYLPDSDLPALRAELGRLFQSRRLELYCNDYSEKICHQLEMPNVSVPLSVEEGLTEVEEFTDKFQQRAAKQSAPGQKR